jgi:hypothetical protein
VLTGEERRGRDRAKAAAALHIERLLEAVRSAPDVAGTEGGPMTNADDHQRAVRQLPNGRACNSPPAESLAA